MSDSRFSSSSTKTTLNTTSNKEVKSTSLGSSDNVSEIKSNYSSQKKIDKNAEIYIEQNGKSYTKDEYTKLTKEESGAEYVAKIEKKTYRIKLRCIDSESISYFTEGGCWMLMRELNNKYGWGMKAVLRKNVYVHGFCTLPNGDCIDITGIKKAEEMLKLWKGDVLEDSPKYVQIGQKIDLEPNSFMSTLRLASIFAEEVQKTYTSKVDKDSSALTQKLSL